jgi:hypothetical protein
MAIYRPKTIGDAPEGPQRSGGCRRSYFLASRGMRKAQGKKVAATALRLRRSRRSRSSARSSHHRGPVRRVLNHKSGRRWRPSVGSGKRSLRFSVGKETKECKSGSRQHKANRKRLDPAATSMCAGRNQRCLIEALRRRSRLPFSEARCFDFGTRFQPISRNAGCVGSPLMRCGCKNWLRTASD